MPLTKEKQDQAKKVVVVLTQRMRTTKVRIPDRVEDMSLRWLCDTPFFSEFLLRFNYYLTNDIPTMGVNSIKGRLNLYINEKFMNGGMKLPKIGEDGRPIIKMGKDGKPKLDKNGDVQFVMETWKGLNDRELEAVLVHEIMHLVRMHHERLHDSNPYIWNISGDMLINEDIKEMEIAGRKLKLPAGAIYLKMARDDGYKGEAVTEPLYDWLLDIQQQYQNQMQDLLQQQGGQGQGQCQTCGGSGQSKDKCETCGGTGKVPKKDESSGDKDGKGNGQGKEKSDKKDGKGSGDQGDQGQGDQQQSNGGNGAGGQEMENCPDCNGSGNQPCPDCGGTGGGNGRDTFDARYGSNIDVHEVFQESDELAESTIKEAIDTAKIRGWGRLSGNMIEKLEELTQPAKLPWPKLLRKALSNYIFSHGQIYENSWSRRNRRQLPLPGIKKLSNRVVIGVDTSGSIGNREFQQFFAELEKIVKEGSSITLVQWDTTVKDVKEGYNKGDWRKIEIKGRGGTDVQKTFDWMIENKREKDLLVMLTDGYFDYGYDVKELNVLWCVTVDGNEPPGGKVVHIEMQQ
jgi:predicted metal-dependent peptidase